MNPWWKRPSSESSSSASREADKRSRPQRSESNDDSGSGNSGGSRRRRGRRGGGRGGAQENNAKSGNQENSNNKRRSRGGRGRGGSARRGRRGGRGRADVSTVALLVDVEALHKTLKLAGRKPEDATELFANVGSSVARRAVASGMRKQKAQRALSGVGFDLERVEGGAGAARLQLALDAVELALANRGAKLYLLADGNAQAGEGRRSAETKLLGERLRNHGADVTYFSIDEPLVLGATDADSDDSDAASERSGKPKTSGRGRSDRRSSGSSSNASDDGASSCDSDSAHRDSSAQHQDASESGGRRRRRRGRRGRGEASNDSPEATTDSANTDAPSSRRGRSDRNSRGDRGGRREATSAPRKSTSEPLSLLTAAIGKLMDTESQLLWATKVRQEMSSIDPLFSEVEHGYDDFEALLREAERRGRIALQKDPRTSTFVIVGWRAA